MILLTHGSISLQKSSPYRDHNTNGQCTDAQGASDNHPKFSIEYCLGAKMGFKHIYVHVAFERSKLIFSQIDWHRFEVPSEHSNNEISNLNFNLHIRQISIFTLCY